MYLLRLAPISTDRVKDWQDFDAITVTSNDPDYSLVGEWSPSKKYSTGEYAIAGQYVLISLCNNNEDDPTLNYIGRTPDPWRDKMFGYGRNTWLRARMVTSYKCFDRVSPSYTWSISGGITINIRTKKAMSAINSAIFFGDSVTSTPLYLILCGVSGDSVTITFRNSQTDTTISTETISIDHDDSFCPDWCLNMELPGSPKNTILRRYDGSTGVDTITVTITKPTTQSSTKRAGLGGFYIGRASRVGVTQQDSISFEFMDLTKVTEDAWGHVSLRRGKVAKVVNADIFVRGDVSDNIYALAQHIRATPSFFLFSNNIDAASSYGAISGLTSVMGLLKASSINKINNTKSILSCTVEGMPISFDDIMIKERISVCGIPSLPVIPPIDAIPVPPDVPIVSPKPVTGVLLDRTYMNVYVGKTYTLLAQVIPVDAGNKGVTWASKQPLVCSVNSLGIIKGISIGVTQILCTTNDGGFVTSCTVRVMRIIPAYNRDIFIFKDEPLVSDIFTFDTQIPWE